MLPLIMQGEKSWCPGCTQGSGAVQGHRSGVDPASQKTTATHDQATGPGGQSVLVFPDGTTGQRVKKH